MLVPIQAADMQPVIVALAVVRIEQRRIDHVAYRDDDMQPVGD